jgi:hypothetical protein
MARHGTAAALLVICTYTFEIQISKPLKARITIVYPPTAGSNSNFWTSAHDERVRARSSRFILGMEPQPIYGSRPTREAASSGAGAGGTVIVRSRSGKRSAEVSPERILKMKSLPRSDIDALLSQLLCSVNAKDYKTANVSTDALMSSINPKVLTKVDVERIIAALLIHKNDIYCLDTYNLPLSHFTAYNIEIPLKRNQLNGCNIPKRLYSYFMKWRAHEIDRTLYSLLVSRFNLDGTYDSEERQQCTILFGAKQVTWLSQLKVAVQNRELCVMAGRPN